MDIRLATIAVTSTGAAGPDDDAVDLEGNDSAMVESLRHPAFLIYPIIYVVCTLPLALGRIATMAGAEVPLSYFCAAGGLITSNGWLDVLLWGSTRRSIVFGDVGEEDVGINTFTFMRTPPNRRFGNIVWVEGGVNNKGNKNGNNNKHDSSRDSSNTSSHIGTRNNSRSSSRDRSGGLFGNILHKDDGRSEAVRGVRDRVMRGPRGWRELGSSSLGTPSGSGSANRAGAVSLESLQRLGDVDGRSVINGGAGGSTSGGLAIQMELETSVVVEIEDVSQRTPRSRAPSTSLPTYDEKDMPYLPPIT